ncbi:MAG TPA: lipoprotein [Lamprocystis sp. (in: g-proteobacteria)]|nr:lipoprotein [Lamprocystis sp. (in: g-proteobacteria)]
MFCWARYLFGGVVISLWTLSMIGACGQKGPLYLPDPVSVPASGGVPTQPAPTQGADVPRPAAQVGPPPGQQ